MKRRFIQMREPPYDFVEVTEDFKFDGEHTRHDRFLYGDRSYDGLSATDGTDISTRTRHRRYMREKGLTTMDDFTQTWARAREQRNEYFTSGKGGATRKEDVARAIATLENKKRN